jgi:hypothetical protein
MSDNKKGEDFEMEEQAGERDRFIPKEPVFRPATPTTSIMNHPMLPLLSYCASSILMTVLNKYCLSGDFNLNFFLLCVQVCRAAQTFFVV